MANRYYRNSKIIDGKYYSPPRVVRTPPDFSDIPGREFIIEAGDRLEIICEQIYENPDFWRALAIYNSLSWFFLPAGTIIRIPTPEGMQKILERL